jgi:hypothetical protein
MTVEMGHKIPPSTSPEILLLSPYPLLIKLVSSQETGLQYGK